jgi:hypothetical protein
MLTLIWTSLMCWIIYTLNKVILSRIERAINLAIAPVVDETPRFDHFDDGFDDFFSEDIEKTVAQYGAPTPREGLGLGQKQIENAGAT